MKVQVHTLGEIIVKFEMPKKFIDDINNVFDEKEATAVDWTTSLAGKIKKEKLVNHLLSDDMKIIFQSCFQEYMRKCGTTYLDYSQTVLDNA